MPVSRVKCAGAGRRVLAVLIALLALVPGLGGIPRQAFAAPDARLDWQWRNPFPGSNDLHAVIFAQERFIAVGDYGAILVSASI